jgi:predicted DNA-binding protein YlxM (UPF0122 family)
LRFLFLVGNEDYEDVLVKKGDKDINIDLNKLPMLEMIDDNKNKKVITGSYDIAKFIAKKIGLAGKNSAEETAVNDVIKVAAQLFNEYNLKVVPALKEPANEREKIINEFVNNEIPKILAKLNSMLEEVNWKKFFVGNDVSIGLI